jgi:hypothetical protein
MKQATFIKKFLIGETVSTGNMSEDFPPHQPTTTGGEETLILVIIHR